MAIFIDLENLFGGYGGGVLGVPISRLIRGIRHEVTALGISTGAATTRAYANWSHPGMSTYRREMVENGVEPVQVWSYGGPEKDPRERKNKNAADIHLVVDALTVAGEAPWIDVFAIVSGDGDFIPLVRRLQFLGKIVIGVTISHARAGGVSQNLRAAADRFIELQVDDELSAPPVIPTSQQRPTSTLDQSEVRPVPQIVPSNKVPSREEYVATTLKLAQDYPQSMKKDDVNGAYMNSLLRRRWPRVTYADFGYRSFGTFIEEGCGLSIFRPQSAQGVPGTSAKISESADNDALETVDRAGFVDAVRRLFQDGGRLSTEIQQRGTSGYLIDEINQEIQRSIKGVQMADVGSVDVLPFLQVVLPQTSLTLVKDGATQRVVHHNSVDGRETYPSLDDSSFLRASLETVPPNVSYPPVNALSDVLMELTLQLTPIAPTDLLDFVGNELPEVSAEQIRQAFNLLITVGAFREDEDGGTIILSSDIQRVDDGVRLVLQDAERRAKTLGWDVTEESVHNALFPD
ncbi:NYN domain-containing protein [Arthrobacter sp. CAL618]|uniref:NYN domain-containing protein n=1 Tax=Arthrobacter sp. CAL618 TaxID=1055770 RepID=UPI000A05B5E2|nr:NYN domain-containing protein [Arthrobacter sp. CAL618]